MPVRHDPQQPAESPEPGRSRLGGFWLPAVIVMAGVAAYANSLSGPFVFDDLGSITDNPTIRHLWPIWSALRAPVRGETGGRPVMNLSYAVNYALGGMNVWGYHALNLLIHILAGLTLFGIVRRTLRSNATLAFAIALIWTVHPLQTEAVTYVSERAESLMGLFYLLTLYGFIRYAEVDAASPPRFGDERGGGAASASRPSQTFRWGCFSVAACMLGLATKEVMVTAPVLVLLYDRTFVSGTFREALRRRWKYYAGLASSWLLSAYLMSDVRQRVLGLDLAGSWWQYALTESRVILNYLWLAVWPHPLVFDYGSGIKLQTWAVAPYAAVVLLLLGATAWALFRPSWRGSVKPALGFAGAWVFLTLAPTSSVVALSAQPMAEHRMYLPLAAVVAIVVMGIYGLLDRGMGFQPMKRQHGLEARATLIRWGWPVVILVAIVCVVLTARRNETYRSEESLWSDTVAKRPDNERAHCSLGNALNVEGRTQEAIAQYEEALRLNPDDAEAHCDLGNALNAEGFTRDAIAQFDEAIRLKPDFVEAHSDLANVLNAEGRTPEAIAQSEEALRLKPDDAEAHNNLGGELEVTPGRLNDAIAQYEEALRLKPEYTEARRNLGDALNAAGRAPEAITQYVEALRFKPDYAEAHYGLGNVLIGAGRTSDAIAQYEETVRLKPNFAEAHNNLGNALNTAGRTSEAIVQYEAALRLKPDSVAARLNLAVALLKTPGRTADAMAQLDAVLRLDPANEPARQILDRIRSLQP